MKNRIWVGEDVTQHMCELCRSIAALSAASSNMHRNMLELADQIFFRSQHLLWTQQGLATLTRVSCATIQRRQPSPVEKASSPHVSKSASRWSHLAWAQRAIRIANQDFVLIMGSGADILPRYSLAGVAFAGFPVRRYIRHVSVQERSHKETCDTMCYAWQPQNADLSRSDWKGEVS